ncbi:ESX secretion-associated protein EspG [Pseudonocardia spirodelae]|uniref:ESX secretion-associated protein EspG n=1 Tax=Pseudonocardia spirodelae TaxID=3133431 RepID=A0ABU8TC13_9PSEU
MSGVRELRGATVLSTTEFDVACDLLDLPRPAVLELTGPGRTERERAQVVRDTLAVLVARGLAGPGGVDAGLATDLDTVARPDRTRELHVAEPYPLRAVVGLRGRRAVLAVRSDDHVAVAPVAVDRAAAVLVELLGPIRSGPGPQVRLPMRALVEVGRACAQDRDRLRPELLRRGATAAEVALLERMAEVYALAELGAGGAPGSPRPRAFLLVQATPHGHYRQIRTTPDRLGGEPSADAVVRAGPADAAGLVAELEGLADEVGRAVELRAPGAR